MQPGPNNRQGLSKEELETITDDASVKDPNDLEEQKLMSEWEQHMSDFVPEDINTIVVEPRQEIVSP